MTFTNWFRVPCNVIMTPKTLQSRVYASISQNTCISFIFPNSWHGIFGGSRGSLDFVVSKYTENCMFKMAGYSVHLYSVPQIWRSLRTEWRSEWPEGITNWQKFNVFKKHPPQMTTAYLGQPHTFWPISSQNTLNQLICLLSENGNGIAICDILTKVHQEWD